MSCPQLIGVDWLSSFSWRPASGPILLPTVQGLNVFWKTSWTNHYSIIIFEYKGKRVGMKSRHQINKRTKQKTISHQWFGTDTSCITLIGAFQCKQHSIKRIVRRDREEKMISWLRFRKFSLRPHGTLWGLITVHYNGNERRQLFWRIVRKGLASFSLIQNEANVLV